MALSGRTKAKPRPNALKHPASPLDELRLRAHLTIPELGKRFDTSNATIARWLDGTRSAPLSFIRGLARAAAGDISEVAAAQEAYRRKRQCRESPPTLEIVLPPGVDVREARRLALEAIRNATARVRAQGTT